MSVVVADTEEIRQRRVGRRHKNQQHLIEEDDVDDIKKVCTTKTTSRFGSNMSSIY